MRTNSNTLELGGARQISGEISFEMFGKVVGAGGVGEGL